MASNSVIHGPKLNFKNFLKVLPESGVISKPMISDICFQCRGLIPWLHNVEMTGIFAFGEKDSNEYSTILDVSQHHCAHIFYVYTSIQITTFRGSLVRRYFHTLKSWTWFRMLVTTLRADDSSVFSSSLESRILDFLSFSSFFLLVKSFDILYISRAYSSV